MIHATTIRDLALTTEEFMYRNLAFVTMRRNVPPTFNVFLSTTIYSVHRQAVKFIADNNSTKTSTTTFTGRYLISDLTLPSTTESRKLVLGQHEPSPRTALLPPGEKTDLKHLMHIH